MSVIFENDPDSSIYHSEEEVQTSKEKVIQKKQNIGNKVPYGRKRSCWKKTYSVDDNSSPNKSVSEPGVITCAVCGIQRYYKFIKQTKKFGLHSCEPCRKFISSMILNVKNNEQILLNCVRKGPENCLLTESIPLRNGVSRSRKDALSNMRCNACWLSLCLEKYEMPPGLRNLLAQFIAEDDRPSFSTNDTENQFGEIDFNQLTKRRSHNYEDKSCMKVLSEKFLENSGLLDNIEDTKNKVIILRIKC